MPFTSRSNWDILLGIVSLLALLAGVAWILWRTLRRNEDPPRLVFKWVLTAITSWILVRYVMPGMIRHIDNFDIPMAVIDAAVLAVIGVVLTVIWRHSIAAMIAKPFASLYDGGNVEADPTPFYSTAQAKRCRGDYTGARNEVRHQLKRFPKDVQGQMLLAEIEAQDFKDLRAAEIIVNRFIAQPDHAPTNIAYALNTMADWHLKYAQDQEEARACIERIVALIPDTEWAQRAAQRLAHMGSTELLMGRDHRRTFKVTHIEGDPGLDKKWNAVPPPPDDPAAAAADYVTHLENFPHDADAREKLAQIYARHFRRLDLAEDQLEQLVQYPNQPSKQVVRWLNLLADLQVESGVPYINVRATLQRIIDLYPNAASASMTQNRIERLKLEFKGKEKSQAVTLGSYEDDLGLKGGSAHKL